MRRQKNHLILGLVIVALALSLFAVYQTSASTCEACEENNFKEQVYDVIDAYVAEKSGQAQPSDDPIDVSTDDDPVKGNEKAKVTIVEFSDFECPYCGRYFRDTFPQIMENYVDTGKVKYVFRDFPLAFHASAVPAGNAAECIREQGGDEMFFDYHDVLYANQTDLSVPKLKEYAAQFNINQSEFNACLDSGKYDEEMQNDFNDGQSYGVRGTPAFFINGKLVSGAQPYAVFEAAIEEALNE